MNDIIVISIAAVFFIDLWIALFYFRRINGFVNSFKIDGLATWELLGKPTIGFGTSPVSALRIPQYLISASYKNDVHLLDYQKKLASKCRFWLMLGIFFFSLLIILSVVASFF
jgi:hypothetical protein